MDSYECIEYSGIIKTYILVMHKLVIYRILKNNYFNYCFISIYSIFANKIVLETLEYVYYYTFVINIFEYF